MQLANSVAVRSSMEYRHWMQQCFRYMASEGLLDKLRTLCAVLLGPPEVCKPRSARSTDFAATLFADVHMCADPIMGDFSPLACRLCPPFFYAAVVTIM